MSTANQVLEKLNLLEGVVTVSEGSLKDLMTDIESELIKLGVSEDDAQKIYSDKNLSTEISNLMKQKKSAQSIALVIKKMLVK